MSEAMARSLADRYAVTAQGEVELKGKGRIPAFLLTAPRWSDLSKKRAG